MGRCPDDGGPTEAEAAAAWALVELRWRRDVQASQDAGDLKMDDDVLALILPTIDCPEFKAIFYWRSSTSPDVSPDECRTTTSNRYA